MAHANGAISNALQGQSKLFRANLLELVGVKQSKMKEQSGVVKLRTQTKPAPAISAGKSRFVANATNSTSVIATTISEASQETTIPTEVSQNTDEIAPVNLAALPNVSMCILGQGGQANALQSAPITISNQMAGQSSKSTNLSRSEPPTAYPLQDIPLTTDINEKQSGPFVRDGKLFIPASWNVQVMNTHGGVAATSNAQETLSAMGAEENVPEGMAPVVIASLHEVTDQSKPVVDSHGQLELPAGAVRNHTDDLVTTIRNSGAAIGLQTRPMGQLAAQSRANEVAMNLVQPISVTINSNAEQGGAIQLVANEIRNPSTWNAATKRSTKMSPNEEELSISRFNRSALEEVESVTTLPRASASALNGDGSPSSSEHQRQETPAASSTATIDAGRQNGSSVDERIRVVEQVRNHIEATRLTQGKQEITLRLTPDNLGEVKMTLTADRGDITARIITSTHEVGQAMSEGAGALRAALESKGYHLSSLEIENAVSTDVYSDMGREWADKSMSMDMSMNSNGSRQPFQHFGWQAPENSNFGRQNVRSAPQKAAVQRSVAISVSRNADRLLDTFA